MRRVGRMRRRKRKEHSRGAWQRRGKAIKVVGGMTRIFREALEPAKMGKFTNKFRVNWKYTNMACKWKSNLATINFLRYSNFEPIELKINFLHAFLSHLFHLIVNFVFSRSTSSTQENFHRESVAFCEKRSLWNYFQFPWN